MQDLDERYRRDTGSFRLRPAQLQKRGAADRHGRDSPLLKVNGVPDTPGRRGPSITEAKNDEPTHFGELLNLPRGQGNAGRFLSDYDKAFWMVMLLSLRLYLLDEKVGVDLAGIYETPSLPL